VGEWNGGGGGRGVRAAAGECGAPRTGQEMEAEAEASWTWWLAARLLGCLPVPRAAQTAAWGQVGGSQAPSRQGRSSARSFWRHVGSRFRATFGILSHPIFRRKPSA
jgi:hypothetical protein